MASETIITLYDSASIAGKPLGWNTIVLRTRYSLNFKGVPYKTIWLEYPDIEPTMRSIGAPPTSTKPDGSPYYTLPVIVDPSLRTPSGGPTVISDSWKIAEYLDDVYPSPGLLFPEGSKALQALFLESVTNTLLYDAAFQIFLPPLLDFLSEASRPYWRKTREAFLGAKLEEICPRGSQKWDDYWATLQKGFTSVAALFDKNGSDGGIFLMESNVTFGDFLIAGLLDTIFIVFPDEWENKVKHWDNGRWGRFRDQCGNWRKPVC